MRKLTSGKLLKWLTNQYHRTGFMPTSRDAAMHFKCCQTLVANYLKELVKYGFLLKCGRRYALPRQRFTDSKPMEPGWYWHRSKHAEYILLIAHNPEDDDRLSVYDEGGFIYIENYHGQWCGPIPQPT